MALQIDPVVVAPNARVASATGSPSLFPDAARVSALIDPALLLDDRVDIEVGVEWSEDGGQSWQLLVSAGHDGGNVGRAGRGVPGTPNIGIHQAVLAELRRRSATLRSFVRVHPTRPADLRTKRAVLVGCTVTAEAPFTGLMSPRGTHHSVALDASSMTTGTGTSANWAHICTGSDRILFAAVSYDGALADASATSAYNSVSMTKVAELLAQQGLSHYRLANPASGSNTIAMAWTNSFVWAAAAQSFTGAHATQTATATTSEAATGTSVTKNISSAADDMVADALSLNAGAASTTTPGANQTTNATESEAAAAATLCGMSHEAGAGTVTMSWSWSSASTRNAHSAINIAAAAVAPPTAPTFRPRLTAFPKFLMRPSMRLGLADG